jgi:hypothetical protein
MVEMAELVAQVEMLVLLEWKLMCFLGILMSRL